MELGLSQRELAEALGYHSRGAIANLESGRSELPASRLMDFARVLDTSVGSLLSDLKPTGDSDSDLHLHEGARNAVIVLAGGRSTRNMQNVPNQFVSVFGRPVISWCLDTYQHHPMVDDIVVACLSGWEDVVLAYARQEGISKLRSVIEAGETGVKSVLKGAQRLESMGYNGQDVVLIQESTRPLVTAEMVSQVLLACTKSESAVTCAPMSDSVQFVRNERGAWAYVDREAIVDLQSPDAMTFAYLTSALDEAARLEGPLRENSCAMMLHALGWPLNFCECNTPNMKIIRQDDLVIFEALVRRHSI